MGLLARPHAAKRSDALCGIITIKYTFSFSGMGRLTLLHITTRSDALVETSFFIG